jgi:5S rRNA maturation endonuclease (ribonuclease M5)
MVTEGICTLKKSQSLSAQRNQRQPEVNAGPASLKNSNAAIQIDLRRYLRADHPEWHRRGISASTCRYLGCGFLPHPARAKATSPLNGRLVFQIRGLRETGHSLEPFIISHTGRALSREQEDCNGKYWSYPFRKRWEIYNQDQLLLDEEAWRQANTFGLILVEGFFDVAKLVEAGCRNVGALMGTAISTEQIQRLAWMRSRLRFPHILLFLDRDLAGQDAARQAQERLHHHNLAVSVFDWDQKMPLHAPVAQFIPDSIQDPADMSVEQLRRLRSHGII